MSNAGRYNLDLSNDVNGHYATLLNNPRVRSANINVRRSVGRSVDAFVDLSIQDNRSRGYYASGIGLIGLAADAPNNPFQQDVQVLFPVGNFKRAIISNSQTLSATAGLIAQLGNGWTATTEYGWSRSRTKSTYTSIPLSQAGITALSSTLPVIRDPGITQLDLSSYANPFPDTFDGPYTTTQQTASARLSGTLFQLPGGPANLTMLAEHRVEHASLAEINSRDFRGVYPARSQAVTSGYVELRAPFVSDSNAMPFVHALELQASVRHDSYRTRVASPSNATLTPPSAPTPTFTYDSTGVSSTDFTVAGRWALSKDISFRSSYSSGFLPPSINQLTSVRRPGDAFDNILDPSRNNELVGSSAPFVLVGGGNPDLKPERSRSFSVGAVMTPGFLPGFRFSVDYVRITKSGEISGLDRFVILANEATFPDRVVRAPSVGGVPGPIVLLDESITNIARSRVKALDLQADYGFTAGKWGRVRLYAVASRQIEFQRQTLPYTAPYDSIDFRDGPLKWRGNAGFDWTIGRVGLGWNAQYYNSYKVGSAEPSLAANNATQIILQGRARIPAQIYNDLNISYRFGAVSTPWLNDLELSLGIQNIFDAKPPAFAAATIGYSLYGDPRLRRFSLNLRKHF